MPTMNRVLITGAGGGIGLAMREELRGVYPIIRYSDIIPIDPPRDGEEVQQAALQDAEAVRELVQGVDGIIHLGGISVEDSWDSILTSNIDGLHILYMAAIEAGVKRIVFASSNHTIGFYRRDQRLTPLDPMRPDTRYGLSKGFGELLGQYAADKYGIGVLSVRIGSCYEKPDNERFLSTWISRRDMAQLFRVGLDAPRLHHEIVWGISDNKRGWWDNSIAHELGYRPQDRAEDFAPEVMAMDPPETGDQLTLALQGGGFTRPEYRGDLQRVLKR